MENCARAPAPRRTRRKTGLRPAGGRQTAGSLVGERFIRQPPPVVQRKQALFTRGANYGAAPGRRAAARAEKIGAG